SWYQTRSPARQPRTARASAVGSESRPAAERAPAARRTGAPSSGSPSCSPSTTAKTMTYPWRRTKSRPSMPLGCGGAPRRFARPRGIMGHVTVVHVPITTSPDSLVRREPFRHAHIDRLLQLRADGRLVLGGPAPDGSRADLFYRVEQPREVD